MSYSSILNLSIQVTIVTADGSIQTANDKSNTELFWGVRGGGCNFGVVTEFVYQLHPQRRTVYAGTLLFPAPMLDRLIPVTAEWWGDGMKPHDKETLLMVLTRGPDRTVRLYQIFFEHKSDKRKQPCVVIIVFYNGSEEDGRANFKFILDLGMLYYCLLLFLTARCGN
jgi:FAD/FMN-containing dehydrogenase